MKRLHQDYVTLTGQAPNQKPDDAEFVPFVLSDYIKNPIRLKRIEAGLSQQQLAKLLGVTQGYISRIENRTFQVTEDLLTRIEAVIAEHSRKASKRAKKA